MCVHTDTDSQPVFLVICIYSMCYLYMFYDAVLSGSKGLCVPNASIYQINML